MVPNSEYPETQLARSRPLDIVVERSDFRIADQPLRRINPGVSPDVSQGPHEFDSMSDWGKYGVFYETTSADLEGSW